MVPREMEGRSHGEKPPQSGRGAALWGLNCEKGKKELGRKGKTGTATHHERGISRFQGGKEQKNANKEKVLLSVEGEETQLNTEGKSSFITIKSLGHSL